MSPEQQQPLEFTQIKGAGNVEDIALIPHDRREVEKFHYPFLRKAVTDINAEAEVLFSNKDSTWTASALTKMKQNYAAKVTAAVAKCNQIAEEENFDLDSIQSRIGPAVRSILENDVSVAKMTDEKKTDEVQEGVAAVNKGAMTPRVTPGNTGLSNSDLKDVS